MRRGEKEAYRKHVITFKVCLQKEKKLNWETTATNYMIISPLCFELKGQQIHSALLLSSATHFDHFSVTFLTLCLFYSLEPSSRLHSSLTLVTIKRRWPSDASLRHETQMKWLNGGPGAAPGWGTWARLCRYAAAPSWCVFIPLRRSYSLSFFPFMPLLYISTIHPSVCVYSPKVREWQSAQWKTLLGFLEALN